MGLRQDNSSLGHMAMLSTRSETSHSWPRRILILSCVIFGPLLVGWLLNCFMVWLRGPVKHEEESTLLLILEDTVSFLFLIICFAGHPIAWVAPKRCRNWAIMIASMIPLYLTIAFLDVHLHTCLSWDYTDEDSSVCAESSWPASWVEWIFPVPLLPPTSLAVLAIAALNLRLIGHPERRPVPRQIAILVYFMHYLMRFFFIVVLDSVAVGST